MERALDLIFLIRVNSICIPISMDNAIFLNSANSPISHSFSLCFPKISPTCVNFSRKMREENTANPRDLPALNVKFEQYHVAVRHLILLAFHPI
jgi:hypothetical protein